MKRAKQVEAGQLYELQRVEGPRHRQLLLVVAIGRHGHWDNMVQLVALTDDPDWRLGQPLWFNMGSVARCLRKRVVDYCPFFHLVR